jgi:hypothetical protein
MRHSLTDGDVCEVDSAIESLTAPDDKWSADEKNGYTNRGREPRRIWIKKIKDALITAVARCAQWLSPRWLRLLDRERAPRCWWWPTEAPVPLSQENLQRQHAQCSDTANRLLCVLLGFCFFCWLTLGGSDAVLLGAGREVAVPVINMNLSNAAFLSVSPIIMIALTLYLHIFVERLRRYDALDADQQSPHLFNMSGPVPQLLSWFFLYWMVPLVLTLFTWKAGPRPEGPTIGAMSIAATMLLIWLQIRRCPKAMRRLNIPLWAALIVLIALAPLIATRQMLLNRTLSLYQAELERVDLSGFDLRRADFSRANLRGAFLSKANLQEANLQGADLAKAVLEGADLTKAMLSWAKGLREVDLNGVCLHQAILYQTDLSGANLEGVQALTRAQIVSAITDNTTRFPNYLTTDSEDEHSFAGLISPNCR